MSFENHDSNQIDYDYRKRDLATKYSFAISRLGVCSESEKQRWRDVLTNLSQAQHDLDLEFKK